jgi:heme-degrading monooxygenase HmoA
MMITVIAEHWINDGQVDKKDLIFKEVSASAKKAPGFISRFILTSQKDSTKFSTVTTWDNQEALDNWKEVRWSEFSFGTDILHEAFSKEVAEVYDVANLHTP